MGAQAMKESLGMLAVLLAAACSSGEPVQPEASEGGFSEGEVSEGEATEEGVEPETSPVPAESASGSIPEPALSGVIPRRVQNLPSTGTPEQARPFFDTFSWQSFIALNWPAEPGKRGVARMPNDPAVMRNPPKGPRVWDTYKSADDLFGQGTAGPTPWDSFDNPVAVCEPAHPAQRVFTMMTKAGTVLSDANESFSVPLVDQNRNFARFEIRYDKTMYDGIVGPKWYLIQNLARDQPVSMPDTAIMVKAAWRELVDGKDDFDRYYHVEAQVYDPVSKRCSAKTVGLVGMHIAQKTKGFPQWIWSSFEQVDNVRRAPGVSENVPLSFNNGTDDPATPSGWADRPDYRSPDLPPKSERVPVQVTRHNPIPTTPTGNGTIDVNRRWQQFLAGTVWAHYELVITQWPSDPQTFAYKEDGGSYPKQCGGAFPVHDCVNTTMETYFQSRNDAAGAGGNSCMQCHYTAAQSDFSWSLQLRAYSR